MEFSIDIKTKLNGEITILDYSKDFYLYINEDTPVVSTFDLFKYSESVSLNVLLKVSTTDEEIISASFVDHILDQDETYIFKVTIDGYYKVNHLVLPTKEWWLNASDEYKKYYDIIYFVEKHNNTYKFYKVIENQPVECSLEEILERNVSGSTINSCFINVFYTGNLLECYVNYSKKIFNSQVCGCINSNDLYKIRDFIWMSLNIIDYLIGFGLFIEALRMLEKLTTCGNFCNTSSNGLLKSLNCGCTKK